MTASVLPSIDRAIGATPLVRVNRLGAGLAPEILVKAEYLNPGGSAKDRIARHLVERAEARGELRPGSVIVEATSGNTGVGLALVAAVKGYQLIVTAGEKVSAEKVALLEALGALVVRTPAVEDPGDPRSAHNVAERLIAELPGAWGARQYANPDNPGAHFATTGPEIWSQTGGRVTHLVAPVGTGGTIAGTGAYLRQASGGAVTVVGADPVGSAYSGPVAPYAVEGAGKPFADEAFWPETYDPAAVDRFIRVSDAESLDTARRFAREEGQLVGLSAGTALAAALRLATELGSGDVVVVVAPDTGRNYLSKLYDPDWLAGQGLPAWRPEAAPVLPGQRPRTELADRAAAVVAAAEAAAVVGERVVPVGRG